MKQATKILASLLVVACGVGCLEAGSIFEKPRNADDAGLAWVIEAGIASGEMSALQARALVGDLSFEAASMNAAAGESGTGTVQVMKKMFEPGGIPGYVLIFDLLVPLTASNLAGSSFYTLISADDLGRAIQIDFWNGQAWAREADFTRSTTEGATFPTSTMRRYELAVYGGRYTLSADGVDLFSGVLRTYPETTRSLPGYYYVGESGAAPPLPQALVSSFGTATGGGTPGDGGGSGSGAGGSSGGSGGGSGGSSGGSSGGNTGTTGTIGIIPTATDPIPEPSTLALMVVGLLFALSLRSGK